MLNLFFQKNQTDKIKLPQTTFLKASNNLDSHNYMLERVKNGNKQYLQANYFMDNHAQVVTYLTCWQEQQTIQEEVIPAKKPKQKKGIMGALNSKRNKGESGKQVLLKQPKEEVAPKKIQQVLYIQLQPFSEVPLPTSIEAIKDFLALIYLLALRVFQQFKIWPHMIPVMVESRKLKFIKKGGNLTHQLVNLFDYVTGKNRDNILAEWSEQTAQALALKESNEQKQNVLGDFLKSQLQKILDSEFILKQRKGQEIVNQVVVLLINPFTLLLKESMTFLKIDEYDISFTNLPEQNRQITMEHNYEDSVVFIGPINHIVIRYLRQFVNN